MDKKVVLMIAMVTAIMLLTVQEAIFHACLLIVTIALSKAGVANTALNYIISLGVVFGPGAIKKVKSMGLRNSFISTTVMIFITVVHAILLANGSTIVPFAFAAFIATIAVNLPGSIAMMAMLGFVKDK